ncbi:MAG: FAD-dependent oxidoreductase [Chloroflexota bacterium]|nr:FAD-dependent oxidoreductase [Chloroflexota bacterium]MDE2883900.1 FAD-dependent oxidoreductase [Chloroflexota bacterium]
MTTGEREVVIIGGGIVGIATAYYLAAAGVRSTIIERDGIASHASGFAYGGLSGGVPNGPQVNTPVIEYSMSLYPALAADLTSETNVDIQFQPRPLLRLALSDEEAAALTQHLSWQQAQPGYDVEWLTPEEARALEPRIAEETVGALHVEGSSDVEPYRLTLALGQAAEQRGATLRSGEVTAVHLDNRRVDGVSIATGAGSVERVDCDTVVVAMGPWTARASEWFGVPLPVHPLKGQIIRLRATGAPYALSIGHRSNYAMTKPADGLVWCGTTEEHADFDESRTTEARDTIIESTLRMLPALEDAELVLQTACLRPVTPDGAVMLGPVPGVDGVYVATGGGRQGIMMGPAMGRATADLIAGGVAALDLSPYAPGRFSA